MPKPGFFRRLLGPKKERDDGDGYDEEMLPKSHNRSSKRHSARMNLTYINEEPDENFYNRTVNPYHSGRQVVAHRRGTRSCAVGARLDDPTSDSDDDIHSVHTDMVRSSKRHRQTRPVEIDDRQMRQLREIHQPQQHNQRSAAERTEYLEDEVAWSRRRIELLEGKMESTTKELYKMTNKYFQENTRTAQLNDKCHRYREKYLNMRQKYEELQKCMSNMTTMSHQMPPPFFIPPMTTQTASTPGSYQNCSLMQHGSENPIMHSPGKSSMAPLSNASQADEHDSVKDFRMATFSYRETLVSEASTSRISTSSFTPPEQPRASRPNPSGSLKLESLETTTVPAKDDGYQTSETSCIAAQASNVPNALDKRVVIPRKIRRASSN